MGGTKLASSTICALLVGGRGSISRVGAASFLGGLNPHRSSHPLFPFRPPHRSARIMMSSSSATGNLVTVPQAIEAHAQREKNADGARNVFVDGSWHMPVGDAPRNGRSEYIAGPRVSGALYFDIDDIAPPPGSPSNPKKLPHMKPSSQMFASAMDRMGISPGDTLYVYATQGCGFYHRAYWTLSSCGHDPAKVKLVQGSLDEWKECGGAVEEGALAADDPRLFRMAEIEWERTSPHYKCRTEDGKGAVASMAQVRKVVEEKDSDAIVVDARSAGRFRGTDPEPRPGLRGGRMPGAVNVPFVSLLDPNNPNKFRPMEKVKDIFVKAGIGPLDEGSDAPRKVICSCGSGVTAAALAVGLEECGLRKKEDISIYDGSWIEWGGDDNVPIVTD